MTDLLIAQLPEAGEYVHGWLGAAIGGLGSLASGIFGASSAKKAARAAARDRRKHEKKLAYLESTRQPVINPYADVENISGLAENLTGQMSNPMDNLGVATQAAEFQAEQADLALANTLDTVRATGGGAGGATALAQAALQSKRGVSASIEAQEANNSQLRAQGEQDLQSRRVAEETRIQNIEMSEAQRMQEADVAGKTFVYGEKEKRELTALDRVQAKIDGATAREMQAKQDRAGAITGAIGGVAKGLSGAAAGGAFGSEVMGRTWKQQRKKEGKSY
jgi:hypothetical protein